MALPLLNNLEAPTAGATLSSGNTGGTDSDAFNGVTIGAGITVTADNTVAMHGSQSAKLALTSAATTTSYVEWTSTSVGSALTHCYGAFYFRTNVASIASSIRLVNFNKAGTVACVLGCVNGNQGFQWRTSAAAVGTISGTISANTWYRVEYDLTLGASGSGTATVYVGDSGTAMGTAVSGTQAFGTDIDGVQHGFTTANFSSTIGDAIWLDSINFNATATPGVGPYTKAVLPIEQPYTYAMNAMRPSGLYL